MNHFLGFPMVTEQTGSASSDEMPKNWRTEKLCRELSHELGKCIVSLFLVCQFKGERVPRHYAFTGFLYRREFYAYWITAGHVVKEIERILDHEKLESCWAELSDRAGPDEECSVVIAPEELRLMISLNEQGIDLGFLLLRQLYYECLAAVPENMFIDADSLGSESYLDYRGVYLLGCPFDSQEVIDTELSNSTKRSVRIENLCLPVEPVRIPDQIPSEHGSFWDNPNAFYGRLLPFSDTGSRGVQLIEGMSGGPIFSLEPSGLERVTPRLIGVQSSWLPRQRTIRATSSSELNEFLGCLEEMAETG
jgi:hypothetical protein